MAKKVAVWLPQTMQFQNFFIFHFHFYFYSNFTLKPLWSRPELLLFVLFIFFNYFTFFYAHLLNFVFNLRRLKWKERQFEIRRRT